MDCSEIQSALFDVVDADEPMSAELKSHLAACEACRLYHQRLVGIRKSLARDVPLPAHLPEGFTARPFAGQAREGKILPIQAPILSPIIGM